jgi:CBS domain-containing protein
MKVKEVMTTKLIVLSPDNTVMDVAKIMQAHNIGAIPVCSEDRIVGIVTDRDIVVRNIANNGDPATTKVKDMMSPDVVTATPEMTGDEAARIMAHYKIRRLPVVDGDKLVGIVAIGDLATTRYLNDEAGQALGEISSPSRPMNMMQ